MTRGISIEQDLLVQIKYNHVQLGTDLSAAHLFISNSRFTQQSTSKASPLAVASSPVLPDCSESPHSSCNYCTSISHTRSWLWNVLVVKYPLVRETIHPLKMSVNLRRHRFSRHSAELLGKSADKALAIELRSFVKTDI